MENIKSLTDEQLATKLREHGHQPGPITSSTRSVFEQKLHQCLQPSMPAPLAESEDIIQESVKTKTSKLDESSSTSCSAESAVREPAVFYGIQLLPGCDGAQDEVLVFRDKQEVLKKMKCFPGSRFKAFPRWQDAESFSRGLTDLGIGTSPRPSMNNANSAPSLTKPLPVESSAFHSVKTQDLVKLRKLLEVGSISEARCLIWSNPRYLINSGDTPTILQEGFRYNALHVAAMKNQPKSAKLIIDILENPTFMQLLYPGEPEQTRDTRIQFLVDLYLNTPDKGLGETALHFACKFGHVEVVRVLTAHPKTERNRKNKYGETPESVICSRCRQPAGPELKARIRELLEDRFYVQLWRSEDNSTPPHVAEPWSPTTSVNPSVTSPDVCRSIAPESPRDSPVGVKAFAGPMSAAQAKRFRKTWLTPPCKSPQERKQIADVRRKDSEKGLERIGRKVAQSMNVSWSEYWDFLGCCVDFSTEEGLQKLEEYLQERCNSLQKQLTLNNDLEMVSAKLNQLNLSSPGSLSDSSIGKSITAHLNGGGGTLILYLDRSNMVQELSENSRGEGGAGTSDVVNSKQESSDDKTLTNAISPTDNTVIGEEADDVNTRIVLNMNNDFWHNQEIPLIDESDSDSCDDSFHTAVDHIDSDTESLFTPPESPSEKRVLEYFIYGSEPSKMDLDVVRALEDVFVSEECYPYITDWKRRVRNYREEDASKWGTPRHIKAAIQFRISASAHKVPYGLTPVINNSVISFGSPSQASSTSESDSSFDSVDSIRINLMSSFQSDKPNVA